MTVHTPRTTLITAAGLLVFGLAGCSESPPQTPTPSLKTTSAATDPFYIERPRNLAAVSDPCELLTSAQVQLLRAGDVKHGESEWGQPSCEWRNQQFSMTVAPDTEQGQGLKYTAKIWGDGEGKPTGAVNGYQLVHGGINDIRCSATVGVSDTQTLTVHFTAGSEGRGNPEYADPCAMADRIAGLVLENVPSA
ncbi:DUF3558 domain-containing protein [Saccharopolyspora spinosa]|uniref:DUF3558 domain-containing protein n=1 Tax=Saccharopolyspora spinosa TaxID=60894 RepID=UPI0002379AB1|nr:DUF3558 domain-containing protein [Saccharopolyspora spinosa]